MEELFELYYKDVYRYSLALCKDPHIAEEITQETFFKAMKAINHFKGECDIRVWLCQIAKNTYFTFCHKKKREVSIDDNVEAETLGGYDFVENLIDENQAIRIHTILHEMPEPYKEVFTLRVFGELSFSQIGKINGKTESWARVTYHRARLKILKELEENENE